ncbi:hypothetical protein [Clostridium perfringens]|uniref:hypothetical protein n=1 Tax=Clostridium perfringens TaxID=1502 RepID=UPI003A101D67
MVEILIMGDVAKDFKRLGVKLNQTYNGYEYGVCEVTEEEFKILCDEPDIKGTWINCGWRYCKGSNQQKPSQKVLINNKEIIAWYDDTLDFDSEEERLAYIEEHGGVMPLERFDDLLTYFVIEMGVSQPKNICALSVDLAKYNNIKLSELFNIYQGGLEGIKTDDTFIGQNPTLKVDLEDNINNPLPGTLGDGKKLCTKR